jgi:protein FRG1
MSVSYSVGKGGKLKLKGESLPSSKQKHKKRKLNESDLSKDFDKQDELNHAGGWIVDNYEQITGTIFIEFKERMYLHGLDNGLFVLGASHVPSERPDVGELLTAVPIDNKYIAFKSAYSKYLSVNSNGLVIGMII